MKWRSLVLPVLIVIALGVLATVAANLYFSRHPILITDGENVYNILCDVILIVIMILTILTATFAAILGWTLQHYLSRDLRASLSSHLKDTENIMLSGLHGKVAPLWGHLFEYDRSSTYLIDYSVDEAEKAVNYARKLDEETSWILQVRALNNYLMALSEKGDIGDTNLAYKVGRELEELIKKHEKQMDLYTRQIWEETIYFSKYILPRSGSKDREEAKQSFDALKENPHYEEWKHRWDIFKPLT